MVSLQKISLDVELDGLLRETKATKPEARSVI